MVAIMTKYLGPTNTRGSRIKAYTANGQSVTVSWDHALDADENHENAARVLIEKMKWPNEIIGGATKEGYAFVMIPRHQTIADKAKA